jgi:hypothetical protein
MKGVLAAVIAVLLVAGGAAVALKLRPVEVHKVPVDEAELRPGQTEVTGVVTFARADPADGPPLAPPLTVNVPQRGAGGAVVSNALVGGKRVSIVWDGGRPFALQKGPALDVAPAAVEVSADGVRWLLDGHALAFGPGDYSVLAPVAVGAKGLAAPRDRADFTADDTTAMATHGNASVLLPLHALTLQGPGAVRLEGRLRVRTPDGAVDTDVAAFAPGPYQLTLTPGPGGIAVAALFQGAREK